MATYNLTRYVEDLLKSTDNAQPSFTVHLKNAHWCLNNFNAGAKFAYNHQVASLLDDIRAQRIPVDLLELFDSENVIFYEGCLIVELRDYRPRDNIDDFISSRVVLQPNSETIWADICHLNQKMGNKWSEQEALEVEARILMTTAPPLCLDPDPHLVRAANSTLRVSVPTAPASLKRKASTMDPEETAFEKVRRAKIMQFMKPTNNKLQNWKVLEAIQRKKMGITAPQPVPFARPTSSASSHHSSQHPPTSTNTPIPPSAVPAGFRNAASPVNGRVPTPVAQVRSNGVPYPHPSPVPSAQSPSKTVPIQRQPSTDPHKQLHSPQVPPQPNTQPIQQIQPPAQSGQTPQTQYPMMFPQNPNFLVQQPNFPKNKPGQPVQQPPNATLPHMPMYAFQPHLPQQQAMAQRYAQAAQQQQQQQATNGTPAPAGTRSPMIVQQGAPNLNRPSPLAANQPQTSRSPMPPNASTPQPSHPQLTPQQQQQQHAYNLALQQSSQYQVAHMQAMAAGQPPPRVPPLLAAQIQAAQAQQAAAQAQAQSAGAQPNADVQNVQVVQYPMFNYAQMNMQIPPGQRHWSAAAPVNYRGAMPNGQQQPPRAPANAGAQHMAAVGRAMPNGVPQGR